MQQGFELYRLSGRTDLHPPGMQDVINWYRARAPASLDILAARSDRGESGLRLTRGRLAALPAGQRFGAAHLNCIPTPDGRPRLFICEMYGGGVWLAVPGSDTLTRVGTVPNPCHLTATDLDGDGAEDFVIASLGSEMPQDHQRGGVWWLRQTSHGWSCSALIEGLGRVSDVQPIDFDADSDVDLVVAEFGWRQTGRILLLENLGRGNPLPELRLHVVDPRHGAIHVPVADLTGDGRPDFVALISQEHETVEVFENRGGGTFVPHRIFEAGDPAFGSSGMQLVDFDGDGDLDVLHANGDTLDSILPKPYHGLRWLENRGGLSFAARELAVLPGACVVQAADLDGDGDLDVVASTLLPAEVVHSAPPGHLASLIFLERTADGRFAKQVIETDRCERASCELVDWDGDGRMDLILGPFFQIAPRELTWYRNAGTSTGTVRVSP